MFGPPHSFPRSPWNPSGESKLPSREWFPRTSADRSACSYWWRGVECHFWPCDLPANQQRYEQHCSKQATSDHSEKTNVGFVVRHFPLLHDNYAGMKAFPGSGRLSWRVAIGTGPSSLHRWFGREAAYHPA